jgi:hypothetical protein
MSSAFLAVRAYKRRRGKTEQKNGERRGAMTRLGQSNLVDPASSHMLVSKIKPCMSKYKYYTVKLRMAH